MRTLLFALLAFTEILSTNLRAQSYEFDAEGAVVIFNAQRLPVRRVTPVSFNLFEYPRLCRYGHAPIVVLLGTSTAGKTAIIDAFRERHPDCLDYSSDRQYYLWAAKQMKRLCPEEYSILEKMADPSDLHLTTRRNFTKF